MTLKHRHPDTILIIDVKYCHGQVSQLYITGFSFAICAFSFFSTNMAVPSVIQLSCGCNQYPWGKLGSKSLAATLCAKTPGWEGKGPENKFEIDESKPYAEM